MRIMRNRLNDVMVKWEWQIMCWGNWEHHGNHAGPGGFSWLQPGLKYAFASGGRYAPRTTHWRSKTSCYRETRITEKRFWMKIRSIILVSLRSSEYSHAFNHFPVTAGRELHNWGGMTLDTIFLPRDAGGETINVCSNVIRESETLILCSNASSEAKCYYWFWSVSLNIIPLPDIFNDLGQSHLFLILFSVLQ